MIFFLLVCLIQYDFFENCGFGFLFDEFCCTCGHDSIDLLKQINYAYDKICDSSNSHLDHQIL